MSEDQGNVCRNTELLATLEKMLNNETYSDTVFFVNKMKFYASSHLVSASSIELESMLKIYYENCKDREIKMEEIVYEESFLVILRFMYGLEIDLSQMEKAVLCEVLCLAERFKLDSFFTQLKNYLSKLDHFELDFVVVLLNTARKYGIEDLYGKLTVWAFENASLLVNHDSFSSLKYDVLLHLLKADFFCTQEVDILKGALQWHFSNMMSGNPSIEEKIENAIDEDSVKVGQSSDKNGVNQNQDDSNLITSVTNEDFLLLSREFSANVLKKLLSHIRCSEISILEMLNLKTDKKELYSTYKDFLETYEYFSTNIELRKAMNTVNITPSCSKKPTFNNISQHDSTQSTNFSAMDTSSSGIENIYVNVPNENTPFENSSATDSGVYKDIPSSSTAVSNRGYAYPWVYAKKK